MIPGEVSYDQRKFEVAKSHISSEWEIKRQAQRMLKNVDREFAAAQRARDYLRARAFAL